MKATINGIQVEGTPKEIYDFAMLNKLHITANADKNNLQEVAKLLSELQKQHRIYRVDI